MFENIQKTKTQTLTKFITAIGVEGVSTTKCEKIISAGFSTLEKMLSMTALDLQQVEGFAEKSSNDIVNSLQSKKPLIEELLKLGLEIKSEEIHLGEGVLGGKKICITGELSMPRNDMAKLIKENGGLIVSSVSKNTDYLLTNETDSTSSKFVKAKSLGIAVITEEEFLKLI